MSRIDHWFRGPHRLCRPSYRVEQENRRIAMSRITSITVTPAELVQAINEDGVVGYKASDVITRLLERAEREAVAKTLGISNATLPSDT